MFRQHFKDLYVCDRNGTIVTSAQGKALNLLTVIQMLKSKDANEFEKSSWMWDGQSRFLDKKPLPSKIAFCTFPRSGNSLMRKLLEQATGIATGSTGSLNTGTFL